MNARAKCDVYTAQRIYTRFSAAHVIIMCVLLLGALFVCPCLMAIIWACTLEIGDEPWEESWWQDWDSGDWFALPSHAC